MKFLYLFVLAFLLSNCTLPSVSYVRIIENNSSYDIWISNPNSTCTSDSVLISSNSVSLLDGASGRNGNINNYTDCPVICLDAVNTRIGDHDSLSLDLGLEATSSSWVFSAIEPGRSGECECRVIIEDADIN